MPHHPPLLPHRRGKSSIVTLAPPIWKDGKLTLTLKDPDQSVTFDEVRVSGGPTGTHSLKPGCQTLSKQKPSIELDYPVPVAADEFNALFTLYFQNQAVSQQVGLTIHPSSAGSAPPTPLISIGSLQPSFLVLSADTDPQRFQNSLSCQLLQQGAGQRIDITQVELIARDGQGQRIAPATMGQAFKQARLQVDTDIYDISSGTLSLLQQPVPIIIYCTGLSLPAAASRLELRFTFATPASVLSVFYETCGPLQLRPPSISADLSGQYQWDSTTMTVRTIAPNPQPNLLFTLVSASGSLPDTLYGSFKIDCQKGSMQLDPVLVPGKNTFYWLIEPDNPVLSTVITVQQITSSTSAPVDLSGLDLTDPSAYDPKASPVAVNLPGKGNTLVNWSNLKEASLVQAKLTNLDLKNKDLTGCDFTGADLSRAGFSGLTREAIFVGTTFNKDTVLKNAAAAYGTSALSSGLLGPAFTGCDLSQIPLANFNGMTLAFRDGGGNTWPPFVSIAILDKADTAKKIAMFAGMKIGGCPLAGVSFVGLNLSGIDFTGVDLSGCDFTGATLNNVTFKNTTFSADTKFNNVTATNVNLSNCNLSQITSANCKGLQLQFTDGGGNTLPSNWALAPSKTNPNSKIAIFPGANLTGLTLTDYSFAGLNLTGVSFVGLNLNSCNFSSAVLTSADFTQATLAGTDFTGASLVYATFKATTFSATTKLINVKAAWYTSALSSGLVGPMFTSCDLSAIPLTNCQGMTLVLGDLGGNQWPANWSLAQVNTANPSTKIAMFAGMKVGGCPLAGVSFAGLDLSGIDFTGVNLSGCDLTETTLTGTNFVNADLTGANLGSVAIAYAYFSTSTILPSAYGGLYQATSSRISFSRIHPELSSEQCFQLYGQLAGKEHWKTGVWPFITDYTQEVYPFLDPNFKATDGLPGKVDGHDIGWYGR